MRLLKYNESYTKNYSSIKDIVRSIWKIDEDEILEAFVDLNDEIDYVDMGISLFLKSGNNLFDIGIPDDRSKKGLISIKFIVDLYEK